jgi:TPR repeat protein
MKRKIFHKLLIGCLFAVPCLSAQEQAPNCNENLQKTLAHFQGTATIAKDSLKAIEYLKPCLEAKNANAQLIMGHLYLNSPDEYNIEKGFKLIKKAAKQKHPVALENLGVLYKYGRGCKLNFNKARRSFKKSAKLGNHKAAYSLGYLYLKGLDITQYKYLIQQ